MLTNQPAPRRPCLLLAGCRTVLWLAGKNASLQASSRVHISVGTDARKCRGRVGAFQAFGILKLLLIPPLPAPDRPKSKGYGVVGSPARGDRVAFARPVRSVSMWLSVRLQGQNCDTSPGGLTPRIRMMLARDNAVANCRECYNSPPPTYGRCNFCGPQLGE